MHFYFWKTQPVKPQKLTYNVIPNSNVISNLQYDDLKSEREICKWKTISYYVFTIFYSLVSKELKRNKFSFKTFIVLICVQSSFMKTSLSIVAGSNLSKCIKSRSSRFSIFIENEFLFQQISGSKIYAQWDCE